MHSKESPSHIVGIGASAGGLASLEAIFKKMPEDSGMAFVLVQHLSPDFKSLMNELLARHTKMSILHVKNGIALKSNTLYLIPPRQVMTMADGCLYLKENVNQHLVLPIDIFFESLANAGKNRAIGIILSGTGSDGSRGIQAIHEAGGLVIVQTVESAQFDGMPRSAIKTGVCDYASPPEDIPALLMDYARNPDKMRVKDTALKIDWDEGEYAEIFAYLRRDYGLDFSKYKPATVGRRIERRLGLKNLTKVSEYIQLLMTDTQELDTLYHDLLIGVTEFFRDPLAFAYFEKEIIPALFSGSSSNGLRVWVAACATGEEPYTLAMRLHRYAEKIQYSGKISIFATDVHRKSLDVASQGAYEENRLQNVSSDDLVRYFEKVDSDKYKIIPELRKMLIFSPHNVISDPPFTKMDLVCCRNLLIYFLPEIQGKVIAAFNYSLHKKGILFLGISEGVGKYSQEFETINSEYKIFRKIHDVRLQINLNDGFEKTPGAFVPFNKKPGAKNMASIDSQILFDYDQILNRYIPDAVLLNDQYQVLHYFGDIGQFLKPLVGRAEINFSEMVSEDLQLPVRVALQRASTNKTLFTLPNVSLKQGKETRRFDLTVDCFTYEKTTITHYLLSFIPIERSDSHQSSTDLKSPGETIETSQALKAHIAELELDLQLAEENLQATVEELQTSNEELQATNEELLASNEQLQSTNEELHSLNEELYTVNAEYEKKNVELQSLNTDHDQLLANLKIGVVYLDENFIIRKFNPAIATAFQLLPQDIGRPIDHIAYQLNGHADMLADLRKVLKSGQVIENEIQTKKGTWLLQLVLPYFNEKGDVVGVILTFEDVTNVKKNEARLNLATKGAKIGIWDWNLQNNELICDNQIYALYGLQPGELKNDCEVWLKYVHPDDRKKRSEILEQAVVCSDEYDTEFRVIWPDGSIHWLKASGTVLRDENGKQLRMVGVNYDITERKQAELALRESEERFRSIFESSQVIFLLIDPDSGKIYDANDAAAKFYKYSRDELISMNISEINQEPANQLLEKIHRAKQNDQNYFIFSHRLANDEIRKVEIHSQPIVQNNCTLLFSVVFDITESLHHQKQLKESRFQMEMAFKAANTASWVWNVKTGETIFNERWAEIIGFTLQELEPISIQTWIDRCHPDDMKRSNELLKKHFAGETEYYECEARMKHKNGAWVWVLDRGKVMERDAEGNPLRMFGTHLDITESKQELRFNSSRLRLADLSHRQIAKNKFLHVLLEEAEILTKSQIGFFHFVDDEIIDMQAWSPNTIKTFCFTQPKLQHYPVAQAGIWADCIRDGKPHIYNDTIFLNNLDKLPEGHTQLTRFLTLPIRRNNKIVAVIGVGNKKRDYDANDINMLNRLTEYAVDIILHRQTEEKLHESEEKYYRLLESLDTIVATLDIHGIFHYVNDIGARKLGITPDKMIGKSIHDLFPQDYADHQMSLIQEVIREDVPIIKEIQMIADGKTNWFRISIQPIHDETGSVTHAITNLTDIDALKNAQQKLIELNKNLERRVEKDTAEIHDLYNNSPSGYHSIDAQGKILLVNDTELKWMDRSREAVIGHFLTEFIAPHQVNTFETAFLPELIKNGIVRDKEFDMVRSDDSTFPVLINAEAIYDETGNFLKSRSTITDISERKIADNALRESLDQLNIANMALERASQTKDSFLANMSHELRTPLNGILGSTEILIEEIRGPLNDHQRRMLQVIDASTRHLLSLINDILDLSKIEANKFNLDIRKVGLKAVCKTSMQFVKELALKKGVNVSLEIDEKAQFIMADERRLKQIIVNLLSNAVKFTPKGGKVILAIYFDRRNRCIEISVSDTGIGISPEDQQRLFNPFTQGNSSNKKKHEGTGLGLSLVKQFTELHGGKVSVNSKLEMGSRFTVTLPCQQKVEDEPALSGKTDTHDKTGQIIVCYSQATVLVVDDNKNIIETLSNYLDAKGYTLFFAHDGYEALSQAKKHSPDIILMDIQMPNMDGLEAIRHLRADAKFVSTPIIALTALAMVGDRERCLEAGANDYISKPVEMAKLVSKIETLLILG